MRFGLNAVIDRHRMTLTSVLRQYITEALRDKKVGSKCENGVIERKEREREGGWALTQQEGVRRRRSEGEPRRRP